MRIPESELIINSDGSAFHIHIRPDQLGDKVILVGDPGRVEMFRPLFSEIQCEGSSREFAWITGVYNNCRVTALSTGIGTDNIDIVMTELDALASAVAQAEGEASFVPILTQRPESYEGSCILREGE